MEDGLPAALIPTLLPRVIPSGHSQMSCTIICVSSDPVIQIVSSDPVIRSQVMWSLVILTMFFHITIQFPDQKVQISWVGKD